MNNDLIEWVGVRVLRNGQINDGHEVLAEASVFGILHDAHNLKCQFRLVRRGFAANLQADGVSEK